MRAAALLQNNIVCDETYHAVFSRVKVRYSSKSAEKPIVKCAIVNGVSESTEVID